MIILQEAGAFWFLSKMSSPIDFTLMIPEVGFLTEVIGLVTVALILSQYSKAKLASSVKVQLSNVRSWA